MPDSTMNDTWFDYFHRCNAIHQGGSVVELLGFPGAMGSKKGHINLYFLRVVVFKLSQKNSVLDVLIAMR